MRGIGKPPCAHFRPMHTRSEYYAKQGKVKHYGRSFAFHAPACTADDTDNADRFKKVPVKGGRDSEQLGGTSEGRQE